MNLVFLNGPNAGRKYKLNPQGMRIGRETDNDIQILTGGVSRYHARITGDDMVGWHIADLGSTNGTKVNGNIIDKAVMLEAGCLILIGEQEIRVEKESAENNSADSTDGKVNTPAAKKPGDKGSVNSPVQASAPVQFRTSAPKDTGKAGGNQNKKENKGASAKVSIKNADPGKENVHFQNPDTAILDNIFNDSPQNPASGNSADSSGKAEGSAGKKNIISSLLFYVVLGAVAVVSVAAFLILNEPVKNQEARQKKKADPNKFFLAYEKEEMTRSSIFRFEMLLECRFEKRTIQVEKKSGDQVIKEERSVWEEVAQVSCSVVEQKPEDNISYRFILPPRMVELELVEKLRKDIQSTEFMNLKQDQGDLGAENGTKDNMSRITVGFHGKLNSIMVRNTSPRLSYTEVEKLIEDFTEDALNVRTVSMSVEEMRRNAAKYYEQAREYFDNYQAKPENIRLAIKRFRLTTRLLERFQPRPAMWTDAAAALEKAEKIFERIKKETFNDLKIKYELGEYPEALVKAKILLDYLEPDTESYYKIRSVKIDLERKLAGNKGRRKKK